MWTVHFCLIVGSKHSGAAVTGPDPGISQHCCVVRAPGSLTEGGAKSPAVALRTSSLNGPVCHSKDHVLCVTHTFKDSNILKERLVYPGL